MKKKLLQASLSVVLLAATASAGAATVTDLVTFSATGFSSFPSTVAVPTDPVTGSFTITFDPTQSYADPTTAGISLNSLNIPLDSALAFTYSPTGPQAGELIVGGSAEGANVVLIPPDAGNDFYLHILNFATAPVFQQLGYTSSCSTGSCGYFFTDGDNPAGHGTVSVSAVPLPAAGWLLISGLAAMGGLVRRRLGDTRPQSEAFA
jgi:hypothetical protein